MTAGGDGRSARNRTDEIRGQADRVKHDVQTKAREAKEKARSKADDLKGEARERARGARDEAERRAGRWTSQAGERTGSISRALRAASDSLREEGEPGIADLADRAAEQVDRMGGYLEEEDPSAMLHDLEDAGRSNPGTFLGGTFAAGMVLGRFLRSSSPRRADGASADGDGSREGSADRRYAAPRPNPSYGTPAAAGPGAGAGRPGTRSPESAEQGDYPAGASRPSSRSAPASAGETLGSGGTVDPTGGPDIRPSSEAKERRPERGTGETPVPSPSGGAGSGQNVRTGSAGAASASAGSGPAHGTGRDEAPSREGGARPEDEAAATAGEAPGGSRRIQSSGTPTPGTGARTGDRKEKEGESDER